MAVFPIEPLITTLKTWCRQANVMLDFHAGARTAYERYVLFGAEKDPNNLTEIEKKRRKLVVAFGLDQAAFFPPGTFGANQSKEAIESANVVQITLEFGGGNGLVLRTAKTTCAMPSAVSGT